MASRRSTMGLSLISAAALAFEIALTRLFAIQQFHHFAFVVVSLAVMGNAASGILLARWRQPPLAALAALSAVSTVAAYLTVDFLPFDSYSMAWDPRQLAVLVAYFLATALPFLLTGWVVGACLSAAGPGAHRPYATNLVGSALGCLGGLLSLERLTPEGLVFLSAGLSLAAASAFAHRSLHRVAGATAACLAFAFAAAVPPTLSLRLSPYKPLASTRLAPDARVTLVRWRASARLDILESESTHIFPGLSLNASLTLPTQAAAFLDGDGPLPITALDPSDPSAAELAAHMPAMIAYQLRPDADALVLEPGAGLDVLLALAAGASHVSLPTDEPLLVEALTGPYLDFTGGLFNDARVSLMPRSSRGVLQSPGSYDVVEFALSDSYRPVTSGAFTLTEDYNLTTEALKAALLCTKPDGLLVLTRWLQTPPSEEARAFATLLSAFESMGVSDPASHVLAFRTMRTATLVAARQAFTTSELAAARQFLEANGFDAIVLPGLPDDEFNRFNRLPVDVYRDLYSALLADQGTALAEYEFDLSPTTDNRPFFFHFFRWRQTPSVLASLGQTAQPFGGSGYLVLLALLALVLVLGALLILAPAILLARRGPADSATHRQSASPSVSNRGAVLVYFACLGAGYLLVEVPLIQRMSLLLDRPTYAFAAVLATLLLCSGAGSLVSPRLPLRPAMIALLIALAATALVVPSATRIALAWSLGARFLWATVLLAPAGFLMGIPFAAGIRRIEARSPGLIPWAWAINGSFSGISGVLAALLSLAGGLTAAVLAGAGAYALAAAAAHWLVRSAPRIEF